MKPGSCALASEPSEGGETPAPLECRPLQAVHRFCTQMKSMPMVRPGSLSYRSVSV